MYIDVEPFYEPRVYGNKITNGRCSKVWTCVVRTGIALNKREGIMQKELIFNSPFSFFDTYLATCEEYMKVPYTVLQICGVRLYL